MSKSQNIFDAIPEKLPNELEELLASGRNFQIKRIVSKGHSSPEEFWYDQDQAEWVILLSGQAEVLFHGDHSPVQLTPGDFINIPPHAKHRVESTSANTNSVWLAIYYQA